VFSTLRTRPDDVTARDDPEAGAEATPAET
jgi:hypothetical protein